MFAFELNFLKWLEDSRTPFLNTFFESVSLFGEDVVLIVLMACLYFAFDKNLARKIFWITSCSLGINCIVKNTVRLPRPFTKGISCVRPETATGYSFPSGHTQNAATWSGAFAFHSKRYFATAFCVLLTVLMSFSRIYLGAHYPSDVLVGAALGITCAAFGNFLYAYCKNKTVLHFGFILLLTPFFISYLLKPDTQYADFFKLYGLTLGFALSVPFEMRFVKFECKVSARKQLLRILIGVLLALALKSLLKKLFVCEILQLSLLLDALRYFALSFTLLALWPWCFKKLKL